MKKFSLITLLASAVLFVTMGTTALSAEAMKCGAGKCGAAMEKPACCKGTAVGKACTCPPEVKCECVDKNNCTCGAKKAPAMKCGAGKCGASMNKPAKQSPKEAMKCGTGKCG